MKTLEMMNAMQEEIRTQPLLESEPPDLITAWTRSKAFKTLWSNLGGQLAHLVTRVPNTLEMATVLGLLMMEYLSSAFVFGFEAGRRYEQTKQLEELGQK